MARRLGAELFTICCVTLAGGFLAAALARYSPGYGVDVTDLDPRFGNLRAKRDAGQSLPVFYLHYLNGIAHGDFGQSESFQQPIGPLLMDRLPVTAELVAAGSACGWIVALLLAAATLRFRSSLTNVGASAFNGTLLAVPPAVIGLIFFYWRAPLTLAMTLILLPRLFGSLRSILASSFVSESVIAARARGLPPLTLAGRYFLRPAAGKLAALFGTAVVIAFGCAVPIEALCGRAGIGALTVQAAMAHDLPLLSALALVITVGVTTLNCLADLLATPGSRA